MNLDQFVNKVAHASGRSRKEVLDVLKKMSAMPEVKEEIRKNRHKN